MTGQQSVSGGNVVERVAPSINPPSVGGGGFDCPTVGFGASGVGMSGGGGFGPSWISSDCNARKLAEQLDRMGYRDAALALLASHFPEVQEALHSGTPAATPVAARPAARESSSSPACVRARSHYPVTDQQMNFLRTSCSAEGN